MSPRPSAKIGLPPGTLIHVGERKVENVRVTLWEYSKDSFEEAVITQLTGLKNRPGVKQWIDVVGLHDIEVFETIGQAFNLHPLILEDVLNTTQRPKAEDFGESLFVILKLFSLSSRKHHITTEQMSMVLMQDTLISFQECEGDPFNPARDRLRSGQGKLRQRGVDYLCHRLMDLAVDNAFEVVERLGETLEKLERKITNHTTADSLQEIHHLRRELMVLRRSFWPLRDLVHTLERSESPLLRKDTQPFLRDVRDHALQLTEIIDSYRDMLTGMLDTYLTLASNRLNEVMKFLTITATIFIPLTFIAGIYGMNFRYMPELESPLGYPAVLLVMLVMGIGMVAFFKRKKWL